MLLRWVRVRVRVKERVKERVKVRGEGEARARQGHCCCTSTVSTIDCLQ